MSAALGSGVTFPGGFAAGAAGAAALALDYVTLRNSLDSNPFAHLSAWAASGGLHTATFDLQSDDRIWDYRGARVRIDDEAWWSAPSHGDVDIFEFEFDTLPAVTTNDYAVGVEIGNTSATDNLGINGGVRFYNGGDRAIAHNNQEWTLEAADVDGDPARNSTTRCRVIVLYPSEATAVVITAIYGPPGTGPSSVKVSTATTNDDPVRAYVTHMFIGTTQGTPATDTLAYRLGYLRTSIAGLATAAADA